jgi:phosphoserine phosphatase
MSGLRREEMTKLRLVVFDVDGTLLKVRSSWQHIHEALGTWEKGRQYAEQFSQGLIGYEKWAELDASLWRGQPLEKVKRAISGMPYTVGAKELIVALRKSGFRVVLLSAGLSLVAERIEREIGVDYALANDLVVENGVLTGDVKVNVPVDGKLGALQRITGLFGVKLEECAAVGDDESLVPLFQHVGLGIAFNPQDERLERLAHVIIKNGDLLHVLPHMVS